MGSYPLLSQAPTPVEVELGCDKKRRNAIEIQKSILECLHVNSHTPKGLCNELLKACLIYYYYVEYIINIEGF